MIRKADDSRPNRLFRPGSLDSVGLNNGRKSVGRVQNAVTHGPYQLNNHSDSAKFWGLNTEQEIPRLSIDELLSHSGVWRGINFLADKVACTPLYVRERLARGGSHIDREHTAHKTVRRKVNNYLLSSDWKRAITAQAISMGNSFSYINKQRTSVDTLTLLDPDSVCMYIVHDTDDERLYPGQIIYQVHHAGETFSFDSSEIFHIKGLSFNALWGLPFLDYVKGAVHSGNIAQKFAYRFFKKGANPSFIVYYPRALSPENEERWLKSIKEAVEGLGNSHTAFPVYNDAKVQPLTVDPDKTQSLEGRQFSLREVANFLGLPAATLNVEDAQSYNSLEIAKETELDAVDPWFCRIEEEANDKFLTENQKKNETHFFEFAREEIKRVGHKDLVESLILQTNNGLLNLNESRQTLKRPAVDNENAARHRMPVNLTFIDNQQFDKDPSVKLNDQLKEEEVVEENKDDNESEDTTNDVAVNDQQSDNLRRDIDYYIFKAPLLDVCVRASCRVTNAYERALKSNDNLKKLLEEGHTKHNQYFLSCINPHLESLCSLSDLEITDDFVLKSWVSDLHKSVLNCLREQHDRNDVLKIIQSFKEEIPDRVNRTITFFSNPYHEMDKDF